MDTEMTNPFFHSWNTPFGAPPFADMSAAHFEPAFERAMQEHAASIERILADPAPPDFENTLAALERASLPLATVEEAFFALASAHTSDELQAVEREMAPRLARHQNGYFLNEALFRRLTELDRRKEALGLDEEQHRVLARYLLLFQRAGAGLSGPARARYAAIKERLATLQTAFGQNVLADEREWLLLLDDEAELAGLSAPLRAAAAATASERGHEGKWAITLGRSSVQPFLTFAHRRELRERAWRAWSARGENGGATDNAGLMAEMVSLRTEAAQLLGYASHADYVLADRMAGTPARAMALLHEVWGPARARAAEEAEELRARMRQQGEGTALEPWDWRYLAEKVRQAKYDVDEDEVKPYLALEDLLEAAFFVANELFGLSFHARDDVPVYHPDVRVFEVKDATGATVALFYGDYFARPSKRSGAWMTAFRSQHRLCGDVIPLVANVCNFSKPPPGEPALLSLDDGRTLFHELGHALHGMLSSVTYPLLSGTNVPTDFVELPSQLLEHWLLRPEILSRFARHCETREPMPRELIDRLLQAKSFQQGFGTVEFLGSAFVDMALHMTSSVEPLDVLAVERETLSAIEMPREIGMRHRSAHFQHIFAGGYSAGYYSYLWSAVLDTDAFEAFTEAGDIFARDVAARARDFIYSAGNLREADEAYRRFRGRAPSTSALLRHRGFAA